MTAEMEQSLKHDMLILKAKFLLTRDFNKVKDDLEILAETGLILPMLIYCASGSIRPNKIIDEIISTYPEMTQDELVYATRMGTHSKDDLEKAQVRLSRKLKLLQDSKTDSENFLRILTQSARIIEDVPADKLLHFFELVVEHPEMFKDSSVVLSFSSLVRRNITPTPVAYEAMLGVANQPYSKYYDLQVEARNLYFNREDSAES